jgi:hypothetical protein
MNTFALFHSMSLLVLLVLPAIIFQAVPGTSIGLGPFSSYQATGPLVPLFLQRINDTSFETGTAPWSNLTYNIFTGSLIQTVPGGYNDNSALQLTVRSGNLTVDSHVTVLQDFSQNAIAFGNGLRFRAAVQIQTLQGNSATDRAEASITMSTSIGNLSRVHYVFARGGALPSNTTSDGYIAVSGFVSNGWIILDRNLAVDAASLFPSLVGSLGSVKDARLSVYSTSQGNATYDPRIKYYETGGNVYWNTTETVVFDPDADGTYNAATDTILYDRGIGNGTMLSNDLRIKYVDTNVNGRWDTGEPVVYDLKDEGIYDLANNDPVIYGNPIAGSFLQDPIRKLTAALFDQVELYSPGGNYNWVHNGGFETGGLSGWGNAAGFTIAFTPANSGAHSVLASATGNTIGLAQSIDARPGIDGSTRLQASAYVSVMSGASALDKVAVWLGLVDSSPQANPLSIYYYFKTGTGSLPANTTDTVNHRVLGFGSLSQWLSLNQSLIPDAAYFNFTGYTAPYRIEAIVLEVSAQTSATTSAYFDDISIPALYKPDPATSTYYAVNGSNSTYLYRADKVPQSSFYISIPAGQSMLNITSPSGSVLQTGDFTTQSVSGILLITVPIPTTLKYSAFGTWRFYTTSDNAIASLYATSTGSNSPTSNFNAGESAKFISQSRDPLGNPVAGANVTLIFYSSNNQVFTGKTDSQGWYNQTNVVLPQNSGSNILEAIMISSSYIGMRNFQLIVKASTPWAIIAYVAIAATALSLFGLFLFRSRKRKHVPPGIGRNSALPRKIVLDDARPIQVYHVK